MSVCSAAAPAPLTSKYMRNETGEFVCPHCPKVCEKQNTMYYHIKKNHTNDLPYKCEKCVGTPRFLQKSAYLHHCARVHPEISSTDSEKNPYAGVTVACPATGCSHSTHTKANILIHYARNHCKEWIPAYSKSAACAGCSKTFASSSAYLYHALTCLKSAAPADYASMISRIR